MQTPRLIGLAGTNGSGKDTVGNILAAQHGYLFVSVTDILRNELQNRGLAVTRENLRDLSAEWRRESGSLGVLVDKALALYEKSSDKYTGLAIASLRNPGEVDRVHELGGKVFWVDADPRIRYDRIKANEASRKRADEDNKTYEQFLDEETAEMNKPPGGDDAMLNMSEVKKLCDGFIDNGSTDILGLDATIHKAIGAK